MESLLINTSMGYSSTYGVNYVFKDENIYIIDNHLVAGWVWGQEVPIGDRYSVFHVDRHYDLLQSRLPEWVEAAPPIETLSLDDYLACEINFPDTGKSQLFRWDNYFPIVIKQRENDLDQALFMTHEEGDKPWFDYRAILATEHPENIPYWLAAESKFIFNLDLDYFFLPEGEISHRMFSDTLISLFGKYWREANDKGLLYCTTIALSPEICGGWEPAIKALNIFCEAASLPVPDFN